MTRKLLTVILALACLASTGYARKQIPKAGQIADGVYSDTQHGFSLTLPAGWDAKIKEAKSACRLVLTQEKFELPVELEPYRDEIPAPFARVWLVELSFNTREFADSLISNSYSSDLKSEILADLYELNEMMKFEGFVTVDRKGFKAGTLDVSTWRGSANYTVDLGSRTKKINWSAGYFGVRQGDFSLIVIVSGHKAFDQIATMVKSLQWK